MRPQSNCFIVDFAAFGVAAETAAGTAGDSVLEMIFLDIDRVRMVVTIRRVAGNGFY